MNHCKGICPSKQNGHEVYYSTSYLLGRGPFSQVFRAPPSPLSARPSVAFMNLFLTLAFFSQRPLVWDRGVKLISTRGYISLAVAFEGPNVMSTP